MTTNKGYVILQAGDPAISGPLADGARIGRMQAIKRRQAETDMDEAEVQRILARDLRVAMHREPVDYAQLRFDAECRYGESVYDQTAFERASSKLLLWYAMAVMAVHRFFEWQEARWRE